MSCVRDAFAEIVKKHSFDQVANIVAQAGPSGTTIGGGRVESKPVYLAHVQDEALMRLRSTDPEVDIALATKRVARGRSSKIQNQVLRVQHGGLDVQVFTELQALLRKDADTIGLALIQTTEPVLKTIATASSAKGCEQVRVIHCMVGDGIKTNEAAMRRLLHYFSRWEASEGNAASDSSSRDFPRQAIRYSFLGWVCASHTANLVVEVAIVGEIIPQPSENDELVASCTRWFKYLLNDYAEEFANSLKSYVSENMQLTEGVEPHALSVASSKLVDLYGPDVLPQDILAFFNGNLAELEHVAPPGADRRVVCGDAFVLLHKHLICVEEKPVVTRFWLFTKCVWTLLRMKLLNLPEAAFTLASVKPREDNNKRMVRFWSFFKSDAGDKRIREASLCLRLTLYATNITAQKAKPGDGREPTLVRLGKKTVQRRTSEQLRRLIPVLRNDPSLDVDSALLALLTTESHICIRFAVYSRYPTALWRIVRVFNIDGYVHAIEEFLAEPDENLDMGYSVTLKHDALAVGSYADAIHVLMGEPIQAEVEGIFRAAAATSLDAERKINLDKRPEGRKGTMVSSVGKASRNSILQAYGVQRDPHIAKSDVEKRAAENMLYMNSRALAIQRNTEWFARGRGRLHWESGVSEADAQAFTTQGDEESLRVYYESHMDDLVEEAKRIRKAARDTLRAVDHPVPYSNAQWLKWLGENDAAFRDALRSATDQRRRLSQRLRPVGVLQAVQRLQPERPQGPRPIWVSKLMQFKRGYFCIQLGGDKQVVFFLFAICLARGGPWCLTTMWSQACGRCSCWTSRRCSATLSSPSSASRATRPTLEMRPFTRCACGCSAWTTTASVWPCRAQPKLNTIPFRRVRGHARGRRSRSRKERAWPPTATRTRLSTSATRRWKWWQTTPVLKPSQVPHRSLMMLTRRRHAQRRAPTSRCATTTSPWSRTLTTPMPRW